MFDFIQLIFNPVFTFREDSSKNNPYVKKRHVKTKQRKMLGSTGGGRQKQGNP
jgi:hypothetical protein